MSQPDTLSEEQLYAAGIERHKIGDLIGAGGFYARALKRNPDYAPALHMSSTLAFQNGDTKTALLGLSYTLEMGYKTTLVWWHYGCALLDNKQATEAVDAFQNALRLQAGDGELLFNLGKAAHQVGMPDIAIPALKEAAEKLNRPEIYYALGLALQDFKQKPAARMAYNEALKRNPRFADAALNAGVLAHEVGDVPAAISLYQQALNTNPQMTQASMNLAVAMMDQGQLNDALDLLKRIQIQQPDSIDVLNNLGAVQQRLGDHGAAALSYLAVLKVDPVNSKAMDNLASTLRRLGKHEALLDYPRDLARQNPQNPEVLLAFARALEREGHYEEEMQVLKQAMLLQPASAALLDMVGTAQQFLKNIPAALNYYRQAVAIEPHNIEYQINLGLAALRALDAKTSLAALDTVLAINRFDQRAIAYKALALRLAGDEHAANILTNPETVTTVRHVATPAGYKDMAEFLKILGQDLRAIKGRSWTPYGQSVKGGTQTDNELFAENVPSIQALRKALDITITDYLDKRQRDETHPFFAARPERLHYLSWSIILKQGGYHTPHIHPGGAISCVFYVEVPALMGDEGSLELGSPGIEVTLPTKPLQKLIKPAAGNLVLFPSYMWHSTLPFKCDGERITVAFDVVQV